MKEIYLFTINKGTEKEEKSFYIRERSFPGSFTLTKAQTYSGTYRPEQYVYTGATVGGIHTGGVHKEDAYISVNHSFNGNGYIEYQDSYATKKIRLYSVTLSKKLLVEAKKNPVISKMIKGDTISLFKPMTSEQASAFRSAVESYTYDSTAKITIANIQTQRYVSYRECNEVLNFLKNALNGSYTPEAAEIIAKNKEIKKEMEKESLKETIKFMIIAIPLLAIIIAAFIYLFS